MILRLAAIVAALAAPALSVSASFGADITVGFVTSLKITDFSFGHVRRDLSGSGVGGRGSSFGIWASPW